MSECIHEVWCSVTNDEQDGKCRVLVKFNDSDRAEELSERGYDDIVHLFNEVLPEGWYVDDAPECEAEADEDTPPNITFDLDTESYMINSKLSEADIILIN